MVDNSVLCDHIPMRLAGSFEENGTLYAAIKVGGGAKLLPCERADLFDAEAFEARAREYFAAEYRHVGEWPIELQNAVRRGATA